VTVHSGSRRPLPHLAYLEALASTEEDSPRWHALTAGYAVLQLFDAWTDVDGGVLPPTGLELRRVRKRLAAVAPGDPIRRCLTQLVDVIEQPAIEPDADERRLGGLQVGRVLAAYGKLLQYESSWALSKDVHDTIITYARLVDDEERLLDSMTMVGFSLRMLGRFDDSREAYEAVRETAGQLGSEQYLLLAELGFAKIAIERGNLPAAARMLDRILDDPRADGHAGVRSRALMDRARVADQLGDYASAAVLGHQALESAKEPMTRDRLLVNLGMTLTHLGLWNEARDAYLIAQASAQEAAVRWMAQINLMELAYLDGNELSFEQFRRGIPLHDLPPYIETVFHETCAHGLRALGRVAEAADSFRRMLDVAERHKLNEFVIKAAAALEDVERARAPIATTSRTNLDQQPAGVGEVARSLSRMRELAGL
jgi:predicted negative regulator of RcsB-dependent stress response